MTAKITFTTRTHSIFGDNQLVLDISIGLLRPSHDGDRDEPTEATDEQIQDIFADTDETGASGRDVESLGDDR